MILSAVALFENGTETGLQSCRHSTGRLAEDKKVPFGTQNALALWLSDTSPLKPSSHTTATVSSDLPTMLPI
jgi:hypothetical protein